MRKTHLLFGITTLAVGMMMAGDVLAQPPGGRPDGERGGRRGRFEGERGGRRFGGPGGPGGISRMLQALPLFAALDDDKDGEISSAEIENAVAALKTLDKNEDGKLSGEELRPEFGRGGFGAGGPGRGGFGGGPGGPGGDPEAMVDRLMEMDKNGDKKLAKDEVPERMQRVFENGDEDEDGLLTREELVEMAKQRRGRGGFGRTRGGQGRDRGDRPQRPDRPE